MHHDRALDITELPRDDLLRLVGVFLGDLLLHYGTWFTEAVRNAGIDKALELEELVLKRYAPLALDRLAPHFGIEMDGSMPRVISNMSREDLLLLISDISQTWVIGDGLWFQAMEASSGAAAATQVTETCWSRFAQVEAYKIIKYLGLPRTGGLQALEQAIRLRIYSSINAHSCSWDQDGNLVFEMTECRVQSTRKQNGQDYYPCKSAGIMEYTQFAQSIDPRITIESIYCPPDRVPDEQFCSWRFKLE